MIHYLSFNDSCEQWEQKFTRPLLNWYHQNARVLPWRSEPTPYHVWVSEIMLQQTRVEPTIAYFERFMQRLPTLQDLAQVDTEELMKLWEGLGYYSRVRNMQRAAKVLIEKYGGQFPKTVKEMMNLPGIGEYTAGAILSIAFQIPVPAVDGNVTRVFSRILLYENDVTTTAAKKEIGALISRIIPKKEPGDFNQALMDLGATICRPNGEPLCRSCPVCGCCGAFQTGRTAFFPQKPPKKMRRIENRTVFLVLAPQGILLHRRPSNGLLAGMWEYPGVDKFCSKDCVCTYLAEHGLKAEVVDLPSARHVFTHVEWHMRAFLVRLKEAWPLAPNEEERFVSYDEINTHYALPSAFKTYTALLEQLIQPKEAIL